MSYYKKVKWFNWFNGMATTTTTPPIQYSPSTLFTGGGVGLIYDYSDPSTLYQDDSGTVTGTDNNNPIGFVASLVEHPRRGANLVENGKFETGISEDWYKIGVGSDGVLIWNSVNKSLVAEFTGYNNNVQYRALPALEQGRTYEMQVDVLAQTQGVGGVNRFGVWTGRADKEVYKQSDYPRNGAKVLNMIFKAPSHSILRVQSGGTGTIEIGSVRLTTLYGNHAIQPVSAKRPTYKTDGTLHWLEYDKVDDALVTTLPAMTATTVIATDDGVAINYPVSIVAGDYTLTNNSTLGRDYGRLIINRELTVDEKIQVTAYFNNKRGVL